MYLKSPVWQTWKNPSGMFQRPTHRNKPIGTEIWHNTKNIALGNGCNNPVNEMYSAQYNENVHLRISEKSGNPEIGDI